MSDFAVLFDVDGVLVDSYQAHYESWRRLGQEAGFEMSEEFFARTFGRTSRDVLRELFKGRPLSDEQIRAWDERKEASFRQVIDENFPAMDGAVELIDALHAAGVPMAAGSSAPTANVVLSLKKLGRQESFGAMVTGDDVTRGKPDPQVFLLAAERLGVLPDRCVVIEDAAPGIAAAQAAGMKSVGLVSTGRTWEELSAANRVVGSLRELSVENLAELVGK
jgi:beta-phosphoglucomutase